MLDKIRLDPALKLIVLVLSAYPGVMLNMLEMPNLTRNVGGLTDIFNHLSRI